MRRSKTLIIAISLISLSLFMVADPLLLWGESYSALCDRLAGDPYDPERSLSGSTGRIDSRAMNACFAAATLHPEVARFRYQAGRAFDHANLVEEAAASFAAGTELGSAAAAASLADYYLRGLILDGSGTELDTALRLYKASAAAGYLPAQDMVETLTFDPSGYPEPEAMAALWSADVESLNHFRPVTGAFVQGLYDAASMSFHPVDTRCLAYARPDLRRALDSAKLGDPTSVGRLGLDVTRWALSTPLGSLVDPVRRGGLESYLEDARKAGEISGLLLMERHGCVGSPIVDRIFETASEFAQSPRSLAEIFSRYEARRNAGKRSLVLRVAKGW